MINSENIRVGDIIKVNQNERLPADLMLLYTTQEESGNIFIRTDQLDGETDWKLRRAISMSQSAFQEHKSFESVFKSMIMYEPPSQQIYLFKGKFYAEEGKETDKDEKLSLENTMWANTVLASSGHVWGLCIYTGNDT